MCACAAAVAHVVLRDEAPSGEFSAPVVLFRPAQTPAPVLTERRYAPGDKTALIEDLQRQLQRVGCYRGPINGVWTPATRTAMGYFNDRVNARLPIEQPDEFLLNLAASHDEVVCTSQTANAEGAALVTGTVRRDGPVSADVPVVAVAPEATAPKPPPAEDAAPAALPAFVARTALSGPAEARSDAPLPITSGSSGGPAQTRKQDLIADWLDNDKAGDSEATVVEPVVRAPPQPAAERMPVERLPADAAHAGTVGATEASASYQPESAEQAEQAAPVRKKKARNARAKRSYSSKPPKFVRTIMRNVESAFSSLGLN